MKNGLKGWELTEGMIGMLVTPEPEVSDVIAALESIRPDIEHPFVILEAPAADDDYSNYCQAFADEAGYVCEIRIFGGDGFCHSRSFLPDAAGRLGDENDPQLPNLGQAVRVFTGFIADPTALPVVDDLQWLDVSDDFDAMDA